MAAPQVVLTCPFGPWGARWYHATQYHSKRRWDTVFSKGVERIEPLDQFRTGPRAVVIGGANTDIVGFPAGPLVRRDSTPGHVRVSSGGVARNIAENLARLGVRVDLITVFGTDGASLHLREECMMAGVGVDASVTSSRVPGARYLAIADERGDLAAAINDMRAIDLLTAEALSHPSRIAVLREADIVVVDANLSAEALAFVCREARAPIALDPVSAPKAGHAADVLGEFAMVKPNRHEAGVLLGWTPESLSDAQRAARELVTRGVERAFVTMGSDGIAWADAESSGTLSAPSIEVVNTNGAGDAFLAGAAYATAHGRSTCDAARMGSALSAITLGDERTVSERVTAELAESTAEEIAS